MVDATVAAVVGEEAKIRSDHFFDTALGAGVIAVDVQGKAVLIRYQASNTQGPVFFSALQLLSYTALTDESQRQRLLGHLLSWLPAVPLRTNGSDVRYRRRPQGQRCRRRTPSSPSHCCSQRAVHKLRTNYGRAHTHIWEQISAPMT